MTVWILWRVHQYDTDEFIDIYASGVLADNARRKHNDVPAAFDRDYWIQEYGVQDR